jgi:hypothetical protein
MSDSRTRIEKLVAMASQDASPREAVIAKRMLRKMKPEASLNPMVNPPRRKPPKRGFRVMFDEYGERLEWDED